MRSIYGPDTLLLASKKPRVKELIEKSRYMSEDEILSLPEKPDVIRGLLLIRQFGSNFKKGTIAEKIADKMANASVIIPGGLTILCNIYVISNEDIWVPVGSTQLEAKIGWYWAHLDDGRVFISNNLIFVSDITLQMLMRCSVFVKYGDMQDLTILDRARITKLSNQS